MTASYRVSLFHVAASQIAAVAAFTLGACLLVVGVPACDESSGVATEGDEESQAPNEVEDADGGKDGDRNLGSGTPPDDLPGGLDGPVPRVDEGPGWGVNEPGDPDLPPACGVYHPKLLGHRGVAWNHVGNPYPENTILSAQAALSMGADGVEIDVTKTKDGVVVLAHENNLAYKVDGINKTNCTGKITSSNYADIKDCTVNSSEADGYTTTLDTLEELVELVVADPSVVVALDIKNDNLGVESEATIDAVLEAVLAEGAERQFMLMLYKRASVEYALKRVPWVCHKRHSMGEMSHADVVDELREMGATCLCINSAILDEELLEGLEELGILVIPYALGIKRTWEEILELIHLYASHKVYGLLSEHLSESIAHRDKCEGDSLAKAWVGRGRLPARRLPSDELEP